MDDSIHLLNLIKALSQQREEKVSLTPDDAEDRRFKSDPCGQNSVCGTDQADKGTFKSDPCGQNKLYRTYHADEGTEVEERVNCSKAVDEHEEDADKDGQSSVPCPGTTCCLSNSTKVGENDGLGGIQYLRNVRDENRHKDFRRSTNASGSELQNALFQYIKDMPIEHLNTSHNIPSPIDEESELHINALCFAVLLDEFDVAEALIAHGADTNREGVEYRHFSSTIITPLFLACQKDNASMIRLIARSGANINTNVLSQSLLDREKYKKKIEEDGEGDTYLHWAVENDKPVAVRELLACGADILLTNAFERTPFEEACSCFGSGWCSLNVLKAFIHYGADVNSFREDQTDDYWSCIFDCLGSIKDSGVPQERLEGASLLVNATYIHHNEEAIIYCNGVESVLSCLGDDWDFIKNLILQPSSLKQICRTKIRKVLGKRCRPEIVHTMPIPSKLRSFLALE